MGPGVGNGAVDDFYEGRESVKSVVWSNGDESLLSLLGKADTFFPCCHGEVIGNVLARVPCISCS